MITIPILPAHPFLYKVATQLATTFHLSVVDTLLPTLPFVLYLTEERLELRDMQTTIGPIYVDFVNGTLGHRRRYGGGRKQPLAKAIGLKHSATPTVLDATAGLGRDAFVLASLGCHVQMVERSPVIAALLHDGLQRTQQDLEIGTFIKERLQLIYYDTQHWFSQLSPSQQPDVIYLDPMYPHRKKSALVKKEMRIFRQIVGDDLDAPKLLKIALTYARQRVVVKRPKLAPTLDDMLPSFCIQSKNTRFDVYKI
ncbi:class I SAM-dependent methyltransferase [Candidatus Parabeggiatoa sp. HSG14]|uniref:class I SAM-dependent methyltransferase n=1 Tax=Candidatus Parabeggiatoa sp. HSG14 TaxID=3055593 RepID=UPI0025A8033B|nr:class I SAM-dependent methyltransferase [Thiotrichales bacterium HSG14]